MIELFAILFPFVLLFSVGAYLVAADVFKLPTLAASRAVLTVARQDKKKTHSLEAVIFKLSAKLSQFIHMDEYKRRKLEATLKSAGIKLTPETYIARAWVKAGLTALLIIPSLPIFPILSPVILLLAITMFFRERRSADELVKQKRENRIRTAEVRFHCFAGIKGVPRCSVNPAILSEERRTGTETGA